MKIEEVIHVMTTEEKNAKLLAMELANDKGREILESVFRSPKNPTELAQELAIPLPTVMFHLERFLEIGMIHVVETELSRKFRQIKYYGPAKKAILIIPAQKRETMDSISEAVRTRLSPVTVAVSLLLTLGTGFALRKLLSYSVPEAPMLLSTPDVASEAAKAFYGAGPSPSPWWGDPVFLVFSGALVTLLIFLLSMKFKRIK